MNEKPNFLYIMCDDLNDALGGMGGHPQAQTPHIDQLMARGVQFTNGQTNVPICGPSRASCLTGLAPWRTGYFGYNFTRDPWYNNPVLKGAKTFMEHLGDHGYRVFGTGKIFHNGQERQEVWKDGHGHKVDWGPWSWDGQKEGRGWGAHSGHHATPLGDAEMLHISLDQVPDIPPNPETGAPGYRGWRNGDNTPFRYESRDDRDLMHDEKNAVWASDILSQEHEDPFLLCVGIGRPHSPLIAPQEFMDLYPLDELQLPEINGEDLEHCCRFFRDGHTGTARWGFEKFRLVWEAGGETELRKFLQAYLASVSFADAQIGNILDALSTSAYAENTVVFLSSDNGYHMGEKEYLFKNSLWEESNRVPFVWAGPGIAEGQECDVPAGLLDVFPTYCDMAGIPADPNEDDRKLDGNSLCELLKHPDGTTWQGPRYALSAVASDTPLDAACPGDPKDQLYSLRSEQYRYIRCPNGERELYDHHTDPGERLNLAGDPDHAGRIAEFDKWMDQQILATPPV